MTEYVGWGTEGFFSMTEKNEGRARMHMEHNNACYLGSLEEVIENMEQFIKEREAVERISAKM